MPLSSFFDRSFFRGQPKSEATKVAKDADLAIELERANAEIADRRRRLSYWEDRGPPTYDADHLTTWHKIPDFMRDERFRSAYRRGMDSGHAIGRPRNNRDDIHIEWRIAVCCWAAWHATRLPGDFVECGTNTGIMSLAVCEYVDFNVTGKRFFLFDTYSGIPPSQINPEEEALNRAAENVQYFDCFETAYANFSAWPKCELIRGLIPDTLAMDPSREVAYLSIDMNIAMPEQAAMHHFWPKLTRGAVVILDDYGWTQYYPQKQQHDEFARQQGVEILMLPTGQG